MNRKKFIHSLRGADRPRSAAVSGKLPDPRKWRRDSELLKSIEMNLANQTQQLPVRGEGRQSVDGSVFNNTRGSLNDR